MRNLMPLPSRRASRCECRWRAAERGKDGRIHQADDRADVARRRGQLSIEIVSSPSLVFANDVEREPFAGFFQHALRLLGLLQDVADLLEGRNLGDDPLAEQQADLVDHHQLAGIGDRDRQLPSRVSPAARSYSGTSGPQGSS